MVKVCMTYIFRTQNILIPFLGKEISPNTFYLQASQRKIQAILYFCFFFFHWLGTILKLLFTVSYLKCSSHTCRMLFCSTTPSTTTCSTGTRRPRRSRCTGWPGWLGSTTPSSGCPTGTTPRLGREDSSSQVGSFSASLCPFCCLKVLCSLVFRFSFSSLSL